MIVGVLRFTLDELNIECHGKRVKKGSRMKLNLQNRRIDYKNGIHGGAKYD